MKRAIALRRRYGRVRHGHAVIVDTRPGINRRSDEWRVVDDVRKIRTPWMSGDIPNRTEAIVAAKMAVKRTDPSKLTHRHTRDGEWVIVHSL